jgi:hypothetical protein
MNRLLNQSIDGRLASSEIPDRFLMQDCCSENSIWFFGIALDWTKAVQRAWVAEHQRFLAPLPVALCAAQHDRLIAIPRSSVRHRARRP